MARRPQTAAETSRTVIHAALVGNLPVAATKLGVAAGTGSSAMLSEGVHSIVDTSTSCCCCTDCVVPRLPDHNHPLSLEFADELRAPELEARVVELERCVRDVHPAVVAVFVKPQSTKRYEEVVLLRMKLPASSES